MILSLLALGTLLVVSDPDGVVVTAQALPELTAEAMAADVDASADAAPQSVAHGLSTDQQIERWIAARREESDGQPPFGAEIADDREMHGEFSAGIGTGGYREYGASVSLPFGESGRLELHFRDVKNDPYRRGYYPYGAYEAYGADRDPWARYEHGDEPDHARRPQPDMRSPR